jgi:hypothetical protein
MRIECLKLVKSALPIWDIAKPSSPNIDEESLLEKFVIE